MSRTTPSDEFPQLPQELVNTIIDHLLDDIPSLRSCSLVCRTWREHAQESIFHKQRFYVSGGPQGDLHKFRILLRMSPHLGALVKAIELYAIGWVPSTPLPPNPQLETATPEVLPLLPKLQTFSLKVTQDKVWDQIVGAPVAEACKSILRTTFLTDIHLSGMRFDLYSDFICLLSDIVAVRELNISAIIIKKYDVAKRVDRRHLRLTSLHMNLAPALLKVFTQWFLSDESRFDISEIGKLTVLSTPKSTLTCREALENILKRIEAGAITSLGLQNILSGPLSAFASLRNLQTITLLTKSLFPSKSIAWLAQDIMEGNFHAVREFYVHLEISPFQDNVPTNNDCHVVDSIASTCCDVKVCVVLLC
ncbi:uncharacterized protein EV420DRAFT_312715 [Desarmillaria tabescens]|uniref:F-box domain-containing protein n=1 Tax=Armillaria tabescens TaxID=1929756 RepID=A0AA39N5W9_ARMTA|nr:uncharacterized protein EV420DRAFT_312715 [Desarmillaria tabescens]KAK0459271.1 hypothetical protein EV420DRAFT_312715 [Desarmillaria tabescens]